MIDVVHVGVNNPASTVATLTDEETGVRFRGLQKQTNAGLLLGQCRMQRVLVGSQQTRDIELMLAQWWSPSMTLAHH